VVLVALLSAGAARAETAVAGSKLNLRAGPGPTYPVVLTMSEGARLEIQRCQGEWCRVKFDRRIGYASRQFLVTGSAADAQASAAHRPPSPPAETKPTGPRVWRWHDAEWRDRQWRQFGWRDRMRR
jgi:uncharacterized protein YraI